MEARRRTAVVAVEICGVIGLWVIPLGWMWVGSQIYAVTGSIFADLATAFLGFVASCAVVMRALARIDRGVGTLTWVVVVSMTALLVAFWVWFHLLGGIHHNHFLIPFMPTS